MGAVSAFTVENYSNQPQRGTDPRRAATERSRSSSRQVDCPVTEDAVFRASEMMMMMNMKNEVMYVTLWGSIFPMIASHPKVSPSQAFSSEDLTQGQGT